MQNNISQNQSGCCECQACEQICSQRAISMVQNVEGFAYPMVDSELCVECGLCNKVCPMQHSEKLKNEYKYVYAAQLKDKQILSISSSGGIFYLIAKYIFNLNGIVYGAAWTDNMSCRHISAESMEELKAIMGSKYVHSEIGTTYIKVKTQLREGRWVYFTGTPCQVAGLKSFLGKEYPTLVTSDLVCHGTPSQKFFDAFLHAQEQDLNQRIVDYKFRDKKVGGWSCSSSSSSSVNKRGRRQYHIYNRNMQAYYQAFITGQITRLDCYNCPFATPERVGDITIADFWGIRRVHPEFPNPSEGTSLIVVNTELGDKIWSSIKNETIFLESSMEIAVSTGNRNLYECTPMPTSRECSFYKIFNDYDNYREELTKDSNPIKIYLRYFKRQLFTFLKK